MQHVSIGEAALYAKQALFSCICADVYAASFFTLFVFLCIRCTRAFFVVVVVLLCFEL